MTDEQNIGAEIVEIEQLRVERDNLLNENRDLKETNQLLVYQVDAMGDHARLNIAGGILTGLVKLNGRVTEQSIERSIESADKLVSTYQEMIENKAGIYYRQMMEAKEKDKLEAAELVDDIGEEE